MRFLRGLGYGSEAAVGGVLINKVVRPHLRARDLEAADQIEVMRNLRVTPNIQYWINPDNAQITNTRILPKNIVVFGLVLALE